MQSISHNQNLILGLPSFIDKNRDSDTLVKKLKKFFAGIGLMDRKAKGMLKSLAGIAYFVTLIYFLTILLI
ncbi:MAG TPA: hypothetical protein ENH47_00280 [Ignavibacteriales bacterium]|nr:hypothetical protein [Ignavibacteriales bacterium]